ncbi:AraC family transcriptional regulator [Paenibacillus flagellatus]|uniref:HTH araC/xylS-type domain-containing protein n=1 Tax=Paenibacillus flagellatus TaxID=2211139 RepID=A0A2V5KR96_9BACL|nr:AraC family transcriptional regulator [Paenibacillus flagellatus]PYI51336.1 hypothetical protein DLM86_25255 [Paenibacillus flagellatus]
MNTTPLLLLSSVFRRQYAGREPRSFAPLPAPAFLYITQGAGLLRRGDSSDPIEPNRLWLLEPGLPVRVEPHADLLVCYILFLRRLDVSKAGVLPGSGLSRALRPLAPGAIPLYPDAAPLERVEALYDAYRSGATSAFVRNAMFQELVHFLVRHSVPRPEADRQPTAKGISPSIDYMHAHYSRKLTLETLSEIAGFTPTSYSREFKRLKGTSPIDYLNSLRIAHAKSMLLEKNHTVKEVSAASGFGNEFYFSRMFKRHVGISPTMYMNRKNIRVAAVSCLRFHDILQSLGVHPVYAANCHQTKTMSKEEHEQQLGEHLDRMRETEPELIIADHYHLPYKDRFSRIAPTHILDYGMDWRTVTRHIAALLGREREAAHNMRQLERKLGEAKPMLNRRFGDQTVTMMRVVHKLIRIQGAGYHPLNELIYAELGFKPGFCVPANGMNVEFSPDKYPNLGTDHLWIQDHFYDPEDEAVFRRIQATDEWHSMKAVRSGNVRYIGNWFGMGWSTTGRMRIMDDLLKMT